ncbi:MAG TPA: cyclic nucleotide-binding domain-containing protein [Pyrinomonadaceae bacterium]|nr:cyclic nucleotide-binding domain-containing protein [Pyrinomonadaceae bacterium]
MRHPAVKDPDRALAGSISLCRFAMPLLAGRLPSIISSAVYPMARLRSRHFPPGSYVFRSGSNCKGVWVVTAGEAMVTFPPSGWVGSSTRSAVRGELFGLTEVFARRPYEATLEAATSCRCIYISGDHLLDLLIFDPQVRGELLYQMCARISAASGDAQCCM